MFNLLLGIVLIGHGLAHISGFIASWTNYDAGFGRRPWILSSGITLQSPLGNVFGLLWLAAAVALVASGISFAFNEIWWAPIAAAAGSFTSLIVIVPWWNTVPSGAKIGAVLDVILLALFLTPLKGVFF